MERSPFLRKIYFSKTELERMLLLSAFFSIVLTTFRVIFTRELMFVWLTWNLFLAFVPYGVSRFLVRNPAWIERRVAFPVLFLTWLVFIPNSFYILTDLFHLDTREPVPLWFDLALLLSFAWNGLLLGIVSVRQMEKIIIAKTGIASWVFIYPVMFLNALGVYIGRYLRYNSWDVIQDPVGLSKDLAYLSFHPFRSLADWGMIICYFVLMSLIYNTVKKISQAVW